jgi:hypothetical protein
MQAPITQAIPAAIWGTIRYQITGDGTLTGLYSNNMCPPGTVLNEIARKNDGHPERLEGRYHCSWLDNNEPPTNGILEIVATPTFYRLTWTVRRQRWFSGVGFQIGTEQLLVTYWDNDFVTLP